MEIKIIGHYNGKTQNINLFSDFDNFKSFFTKDFNIEEDMEYLQFYILIDESFRIDLIDQKVYNEFVLNNKDLNDIYCELLTKSKDDIIYIDKSDIINQDFFKQINDSSICFICNGIILEPYQCDKCKNNFCKACIEDFYIKNKKCYFNCSDINLIENKILKNQLSNLKFKCKNGCINKEIPYLDLRNHYEEKCPFSNYKNEYNKLLNEIEKLKIENNNLKQKKKEIINPTIYHFKSKTHEHPLIPCFTSRSGYFCDVCGKLYNSKNCETYYCTLCDYDLCLECVINEGFLDNN